MAKPIAILRKTYREWKADEAPRMAAALSYYTVFSLAPLLIFAVTIAGVAFGAQAARGELSQVLSDTLGRSAARTVESMIEAAGDARTGAGASAIGGILLLLGASRVVGELKAMMNHIWGVSAAGGVKMAIRKKGQAMAIVLGFGFLFLVSLTVSALVAAFGAAAQRALGLPAGALAGINAAASAAVFTLVFAALFQYLPDARLPWRSVWTGAAVTALLFIAGKGLLGWYLGRGATSAYGAAGSVLAILLWTYYASLIFYFGAELTKTLVRETEADGA